MVRESSNPALFGRVDELHVALRLALVKKKQTTETHLVLLKHHKVKMLNPLFPIIPHPFLHGGGTKDIPDIFIDERVSARMTKTHVSARNPASVDEK